MLTVLLDIKIKLKLNEITKKHARGKVVLLLSFRVGVVKAQVAVSVHCRSVAKVNFDGCVRFDACENNASFLFFY